MAAIDNEATTINDNFDDSTQIVGHEHSSCLDAKEKEENDAASADPQDRDSSQSQKKAKTAVDIAAGSAAIGTAATIFMNAEDSTADPALEEADLEVSGTISENVVELPEVTVEAVRTVREDIENTGRAPLGDNSPAAETVYAEVTGGKPEETVQGIFSQPNPGEGMAAQIGVEDEGAMYGDDIPVVSVGSAEDSDIQILGVTQDISTGYNVGHLSVDGEEVVVIDVDGDMVFDSMVVDLNHDGEITPDEIIDISQQSNSLEGLQPNSDLIDNPMTMTGDSPDYLSEVMD